MIVVAEHLLLQTPTQMEGFDTDVPYFEGPAQTPEILAVACVSVTIDVLDRMIQTGEYQAKTECLKTAMTETFDLFFHCFQQNHRIPNCFCGTLCNDRVVREEKRLLAGPGKRCGPEQSG
jgi:hypothetical protein